MKIIYWTVFILLTPKKRDICIRYVVLFDLQFGFMYGSIFLVLKKESITISMLCA